ncbi:pentapeptide repeat-containing protein [Komagataeibacter oboediens]|uniref:pentapeptide repeat-containing protein n=1 Tax=Komagataeibacter oboediens TaxID=65958 RepID=UPI000237E3D2|nr:pentapeptide repeat-containing protein [Komagataeibacter oboediens]
MNAHVEQTDAPEIFQIKSRFTGEVRFECELSAEVAGRSFGLKLGFSVKKAIEARTNLSGTNLAGANLSCANLARADLGRADLGGANLYCADLGCANLGGANLSCADLGCANLGGANLSGANLAGADLAGAYLGGANLSGAKWRNGIILKRAPLQIFNLFYRVTILDMHMQIGCELHLISEWREFDNEQIARMDGVDSRRFWKKHRDALFALAESDGRGVEEDQADKSEDDDQEET